MILATTVTYPLIKEVRFEIPWPLQLSKTSLRPTRKTISYRLKTNDKTVCKTTLTMHKLSQNYSFNLLISQNTFLFDLSLNKTVLPFHEVGLTAQPT